MLLGPLRSPKQSSLERESVLLDGHKDFFLEFVAAYDFFQLEQCSFYSQPTDRAAKGSNNYRPNTRNNGADRCSNGRSAQDCGRL